MFDIKKILRDAGVESGLVDTLADTIKAEIPKEFVSKTQYSKKVNQIDELNGTIADLEAKVSNPTTDEFKGKYETLEKEFNDFKNNIELEKTTNIKTSLLEKKLKGEGVNDKLVKLLMKEFDLNNLEVENDDFKGWADIVQPVRENYSDFFSKVEESGATPIMPPTLGSGGVDPFIAGFGK